MNILKSSVILILISVSLFSSAGTCAEMYSPYEIDEIVGKKRPDFSADDLSGKSVSLSSFEGRPILLNFWATWCPVCREERPHLNSLYKEYKNKGLVIIAVSTDRSPQHVKTFLRKIPMEFVILHDGNKRASEAYGVYSLPTSFLIDSKGVIKHKLMGAINWTDSGPRKMIDELMQTNSSTGLQKTEKKKY
ncbi:MAG: TlpA family protein disulfide reductase [Nitrospirae bacterium]|nr:TlpA family protein disulfide reductase [Nitrospirota bacterium]